jgi:diguanylate cyclase (GGDEF)-like protein
MPVACQDAIARHHQDTITSAGVAAIFPHWLEKWSPRGAARVRNALLGHPAIPDPVQFMQSVCDEFGQLMAFFGHGKVPAVKLAELMMAAANEIAASTMQLVGSVQGLREQVVSAEEMVSRSVKDRAELLERANRDELTGALNRHGFAMRAAEILEQMTRTSSPVALLYLDVDRFKAINDTCGHATGDEALKKVVAAAQACTRANDLVGRLGGDEFAVLLPKCSEADARIVAERVRKTIRELKVRSNGCAELRLSVSTGVVCVAGGAHSLPDLLGQADGLMYASKRRGGDGICVAVG